MSKLTQAVLNLRAMEWQRGHRLQDGKYTIRDVLGKGGFGITYRVRDLEGRQYVIKTLNEQAQASPDFDKLQQDFMNEALRLAQFKNHPHIVKVYKLLQESVQRNNFGNRFLCCILMEYIEGVNLDEYVKRRGRLSEAEALRYIQQVGDALMAIHREGLLHRDVKPSNIVLRASNSQAVLIDFGLARDFSPDHSTHTMGGTPCYSAFEQFDTTVAQPGAYTDVYALAAALYSLVTGAMPTSALARAINVPLKPPKQIVPSLSDWVHDAIIAGMELLPQNRPQSVQDWLKLLAPSFPPIPQVAPLPNNLQSAAGMDYGNLRDLLAAEKWKEANKETVRVMLKVARREKEGWLRVEDIERFPCEDLRTIDQLWVKYSNGRFGFSVQKRIWLEVGGKPGIYDYQAWEKFGDCVGWRRLNWWGNEVRPHLFPKCPPGASPKMRRGHYAEGAWVGGHSLVYDIQQISSLVQRLVNCSI